jgi:GrpB-like predicted nucleotidyltransferase (UPF0157 family)
MRKVEVVPHDPKWWEAFEVASKRIADALRETQLNPLLSL